MLNIVGECLGDGFKRLFLEFLLTMIDAWLQMHQNETAFRFPESQILINLFHFRYGFVFLDIC